MPLVRFDDFIIAMPDEWQDVSTVVLLGPEDEGFSPNVTIGREELRSTMKPEKYAAAQLPVLQEALAQCGYQVLEEGPTTAGVVEAYQRLHTFTSAGTGMGMKQWQVYVIVGTVAITITATDKAATFDQWSTVFRQTVDGFGFVGRELTG